MFASTSNLRVLSPTAVLLVACWTVNLVRANDEYTVPEPSIEVASKGFRVSIPDGPGVELFAFHGNINKDMYGLEAGQFSKDVLKKCGARWVFEDASATVRIGDKLHFWLYVIRNKLGYRYDDGHYTVKEIKDLEPLDCTRPATVTTQAPPVWSASSTDCDVPNPIFDVRIANDDRRKRESSSECCELFLNVSYRMVHVAERNERLAEENRVLYELASKEEYRDAKTLKLFGPYPDRYYPSPKDFVRKLIRDKLSLNEDDDINVVEAVRIAGDGISFTVAKLSDKVAIILAAKRGLEGSFYQLKW